MRNTLLFLTLLFGTLLFSCDRKEKSENSQVGISDAESDSLNEDFPQVESTQPEVAETPASKPGPGIGTSENGLSTDVDQPVTTQDTRDSLK